MTETAAKADRAGLERRVLALVEGEDDTVSLMATVAAELYHGVDGYDWVGFYRVTGPDILKIGPYQGGHGCLVIPFGKGVCGAAAASGETQIVDDVDAFPGHIACSASTRSEIVVPVRDPSGALMGVLDIDSDTPAFFTAGDASFLESLVAKVFSRNG